MNENTEATTSKDKIENTDYIMKQLMKPKNTDQYKPLGRETTKNSLKYKISHITVSRELRENVNKQCTMKSSENGDFENLLAKNTKESKTVYTNIDNETTGKRFKRFILSSLQRSHRSTDRNKKHSDCHQLLDCGNNPYMVS